MSFEKKYFEDLNYSKREQLVKQHVAEVLQWASEAAGVNLCDGHGKTALDVGCAYGFGIEVLRSLGYYCCGTDVSKYSLLKAKNVSPMFGFAISDAQKGLPFKDRSFDLVTCFEVLEHLPNPMRAIKNLYNSCKGVVVYTTPNRIVDKPVKKILRDFDKTHISARTAKEWEDALRSNISNADIAVESFIDTNLRAGERLLFFKSFRMPYLGLDTRILIKKTMDEKNETSRRRDAHKKQ